MPCPACPPQWPSDVSRNPTAGAPAALSVPPPVVVDESEDEPSTATSNFRDLNPCQIGPTCTSVLSLQNHLCAPTFQCNWFLDLSPTSVLASLSANKIF